MRTLIFILLFVNVANAFELPRKTCLPDNKSAETLAGAIFNIQTNAVRNNDLVFKTKSVDKFFEVEVIPLCPEGGTCKMRTYWMRLSKQTCEVQNFNLKK